MLQVVLTGCILIYYPVVYAEVFIYYPSLVNGTFVKESGFVHSSEVPIVMPICLTSVLCGIFITQTVKYANEGRLSHSMQYCHENIVETGLWDLMFWLLVLGVHAISVTVLCSPVDAYAAVLSVFGMVFFLACICSPAKEETSSSLNNAGVLGYCFGLLIALYCVPSQFQGRFTAFLLLGILDYFMVVGHTWDRAPTMDTVANCRIFWTCSSAIAVAVLYATWHAKLVF